MMYFRDPGNPLAGRILETALHNITNRTLINVWQITGLHVLQSIYADEQYRDLFDGMRFMEEKKFSGYFKLGVNLDYKGNDSHGLVARQIRLDIFRD